MQETDSPDPPLDMPKPAHPRKILGRCLLFVFFSVAAYALVTPLLPARLTGGPMIQNVSDTAASLIWYTSKPAPGQVVVRIDGEDVLIPAANEDTRHRLRLTGLTPGAAYPYEIRINGRPAAEGILTTSKPRTSAFSFIVFGDSGRGRVAQYTLAAEMSEVDADFILHTGDVVYGAGERHNYPKRFFRPYRKLLERICFWPSLGNHDISEPSLGGDYLGVFELPENGPDGLQPERNYWFDYADARIAVIDSNLPQVQLADQVAPWLMRLFDEPRVRWRFVVMHHPAYTSGKYDPNPRVIAALVPVFERAGVDLVFAGHDHNYQRTKPMRGGAAAPDGKGVIYIVTGAGGASVYPLKPADQWPDYLAAGNGQDYSFTHVTITADKLLLRQIALGGREIDRWEWEKSEE